MSRNQVFDEWEKLLFLTRWDFPFCSACGFSSDFLWLSHARTLSYIQFRSINLSSTIPYRKEHFSRTEKIHFVKDGFNRIVRGINSFISLFFISVLCQLSCFIYHIKFVRKLSVTVIKHFCFFAGGRNSKKDEILILEGRRASCECVKLWKDFHKRNENRNRKAL